MFGSIIDAIASLIKEVVNIPVKIIEGLGTILTNIFDVIFDFVSSFFSTLWDFLVNLFKFVFVPEEDFFHDKLLSYKDKLNSKIDITKYIDIINRTQNPSTVYESSDSLYSITFNGNSYSVIDVEQYENMRKYTDDIIRGFMFIFLVFYNYSECYRLIRGVRPFDPVKAQGK